jgi:hypothetical protein
VSTLAAHAQPSVLDPPPRLTYSVLVSAQLDESRLACSASKQAGTTSVVHIPCGQACRCLCSGELTLADSSLQEALRQQPTAHHSQVPVSPQHWEAGEARVAGIMQHQQHEIRVGSKGLLHRSCPAAGCGCAGAAGARAAGRAAGGSMAITGAGVCGGGGHRDVCVVTCRQARRIHRCTSQSQDSLPEAAQPQAPTI